MSVKRIQELETQIKFLDKFVEELRSQVKIEKKEKKEYAALVKDITKSLEDSIKKVDDTQKVVVALHKQNEVLKRNDRALRMACFISKLIAIRAKIRSKRSQNLLGKLIIVWKRKYTTKKMKAAGQRDDSINRDFEELKQRNEKIERHLLALRFEQKEFVKQEHIKNQQEALFTKFEELNAVLVHVITNKMEEDKKNENLLKNVTDISNQNTLKINNINQELENLTKKKPTENDFNQKKVIDDFQNKLDNNLKKVEGKLDEKVKAQTVILKEHVEKTCKLIWDDFGIKNEGLSEAVWNKFTKSDDCLQFVEKSIKKRIDNANLGDVFFELNSKENIGKRIDQIESLLTEPITERAKIKILEEVNSVTKGLFKESKNIVRANEIARAQNFKQSTQPITNVKTPIQIAWDKALDNGFYSQFKSDWMKKEYLSPICKMVYNHRMTQDEWQWQTNINTSLYLKELVF
jgi:hypothetical protein